MPSPCKICGSEIPDRPPPVCPACLVASAIDFKRIKPGSFTPHDPEVINALIPGIEVIDIIGQGGMGTVYLGILKDEPVAIKILFPEMAANPEIQKRFEREAEILSSLDHPGIVPMQHTGQAGEILYLVMDFIEGQTLDKRPPKNHPAITTLGQSLCEALHYAHQKGIVHRDLKPSNILWDDSTDTARIADFGLAKDHFTSAEATLLTSVDQALGTPRYMAPEQWIGKESNAQSDIYSLGVILYELLTGTLPIGSFKKPSLISTSPPHLDRAIMRALATDPADRFATAQEFGAALGTQKIKSKLPLILIPVASAILAALFIFWPEKETKQLEITATIVNQPPAASALRSTKNQYFAGIQIASDGTHILCGAPCASENLSISGSGYAVIHRTNGNSLEQIAVLENPSPEKGDRFGYSVAISGRIAICGAWGNQNQRGSVYVFRETETWAIAQTITPPKDHDFGRFGFRVELHENTLVISARERVFIYSQIAESFQLTQVIKPQPSQTDSSFARSISLDDQQLAIGCMKAHGGLGSADVYQKHGDQFTFEKSLTPSTATRNSQFGSDIAIQGDWLALAGWQADQVALFKKTPSGWVENTVLNGTPHTEKESGFGDSLSLQNEELLISDGSTHENGSQVFTYQFIDDKWKLQALHRSSSRYHFGSSVMKHRNFILTGSKSHDQSRGGLFIIEPRSDKQAPKK